jgi:hypothetical protein
MAKHCCKALEATEKAILESESWEPVPISCAMCDKGIGSITSQY